MLKFRFLWLLLGGHWFYLAYLTYLWTPVDLLPIEDVWNMTNTSPGVDLALICCLSLLTMFTFMWQIRLIWTLDPEFLRTYAPTLEFTVKNSSVGSFVSSSGLVCWTFAPTPPLPNMPAATLAAVWRKNTSLCSFSPNLLWFSFVLKLVKKPVTTQQEWHKAWHQALAERQWRVGRKAAAAEWLLTSICSLFSPPDPHLFHR